MPRRIAINPLVQNLDGSKGTLNTSVMKDGVFGSPQCQENICDDCPASGHCINFRESFWDYGRSRGDHSES